MCCFFTTYPNYIISCLAEKCFQMNLEAPFQFSVLAKWKKQNSVTIMKIMCVTVIGFYISGQIFNVFFQSFLFRIKNTLSHINVQKLWVCKIFTRLIFEPLFLNFKKNSMHYIWNTELWNKIFYGILPQFQHIKYFRNFPLVSYCSKLASFQHTLVSSIA